LGAINIQGGLRGTQVAPVLRTFNLAYKVFNAINRIQEIYDYASRIIKITTTIAGQPSPDVMLDVLLKEILGQYTIPTDAKSFLQQIKQAFADVKKEIRGQWSKISTAMISAADRIAASSSPAFMTHIATYIQKAQQNKLRVTIFMPSVAGYSYGKEGDQRISIGNDFEIAFRKTGGRLFGIGFTYPGAGRIIQDQIFRIDWWNGEGYKFTNYTHSLLVHYHPMKVGRNNQDQDQKEDDHKQEYIIYPEYLRYK
jgi:hypothetical protein